MITDQDVDKLKKVFVTKDDLKRELQNFTTKDDLAKTTEQLVELITDGFSRMDKAIKKMSDHDNILNTHEHRLDHLEDKVFV